MSKWDYWPWRKLYIREEGSFALLPLQTRAFARELLALCDDTGRIFIGSQAPHVAIMRLGGAHPREWQGIKSHITQLLEDGYVLQEGEWLVIRNFGPAQERKSFKTKAAFKVPSDGGSSEPPDDSVATASTPRDDSVEEAWRQRGDSKHDVSAGDYSAPEMQTKRNETKRIEEIPPNPPEGVGAGEELDPVSRDRRKPHELRYAERWQRGIRDGNGGKYVFPEGQQGQLNRLVVALLPGLRDIALLEAIEALAREFASAVRGEERFYKHLAPDGCVAWHNAGRSKNAASSGEFVAHYHRPFGT